MVSKTGKKATNAAEKARKTHKPDAAQRKNAACHKKLLEKNDRKAKNRAALRQARVIDPIPQKVEVTGGVANIKVDDMEVGEARYLLIPATPEAEPC